MQCHQCIVSLLDKYQFYRLYVYGHLMKEKAQIKRNKDDKIKNSIPVHEVLPSSGLDVLNPSKFNLGFRVSRIFNTLSTTCFSDVFVNPPGGP